MTIEHLTHAGGIFSILVFWHFVADWIFQTHTEAIQKSKNERIRARHCLIYALFFVIPMFAMNHFSLIFTLGIFIVLFTSHFIIDSYVPTLLWAKHLRKFPLFEILSDEQAFIEMFKSPIGLILAITVDQLFHIAILFVISFLFM